MQWDFGVAAIDLLSHELDVEEAVVFDEVSDADGEAAAEGVVVLGHHVGKFAVAARFVNVFGLEVEDFKFP